MLAAQPRLSLAYQRCRVDHLDKSACQSHQTRVQLHVDAASPHQQVDCCCVHLCTSEALAASAACLVCCSAKLAFACNI